MDHRATMPIIVLTIVFLQNSVAQIDTTRREFFPLHIGDLWQYRTETNFLWTARADTDTVIDGKHYYVFRRIALRTSSGITRIDSLMRVQILYGMPIGGDSCGGELPRERSTYRLAVPESSVWRVCDYFYGLPTSTPLARFDGTSFRSIFGQVRETMDFSFGGVSITGDTLLFYGATLVRGIGVLHEEYYDGAYRSLQGCIINGVQYGTIVSVEIFPETYPKEITLYQNFPNPFNAYTTFRFTLPQRTHVQFAIYDLLGRKITVIVDGAKEPGVYSIQYDASHLSSGVYFYQLLTSQSHSLKRLALVK